MVCCTICLICSIEIFCALGPLLCNPSITNPAKGLSFR